MIEKDGKKYRNAEEQIEFLTQHAGDYDERFQDMEERIAAKCDKNYVDKKVPDTDKVNYVLTSDGTNQNKWTEKEEVKVNVAPDATELLKNLKVGANKYKVLIGSHILTITDEMPEGEIKRAKYLVVDDEFNYAIGQSAEETGDYNLLSNHPSIGGVEVISSKTLGEYNIYSKDEVNQLISQVKQIIKVDTLPAESERQANTLYYVGTAIPYQIYLCDKDKVMTLLGTTDVDLSDYQKKIDNELQTTSKSIVGAINELKLGSEAIDNKTIIRNSDGKLQTAVGGYDGEEVITPMCDGEVRVLRTIQPGNSVVDVGGTFIKVEDRKLYTGEMSGPGVTVSFHDVEGLDTIFVGITFNAIDMGFAKKEETGLDINVWLYFAYNYETGEDHLFSMTTVTEEQWNVILANLNHFALKKKSYEVSYIDNKFIRVDNTTIRINELNEISLNQSEMLLQTVYDVIYPTGSVYMGVAAPTIPYGVFAEWTLNHDYDGKYIRINGDAAGTTTNESITIEGTALTIEQMPSHSHGCESNGAHQHYREGYWTVSYVGDTKRECVSRYQSAGGSINYDNSAGSHSHTIKTNGGGKTHTHTAKDICPTALNVGVWVRTS